LPAFFTRQQAFSEMLPCSRRYALQTAVVLQHAIEAARERRQNQGEPRRALKEQRVAGMRSENSAIAVFSEWRAAHATSRRHTDARRLAQFSYATLAAPLETTRLPNSQHKTPLVCHRRSTAH